MDAYLLPLTVIPGVAVLITSTVHLSVHLSQEIQELMSMPQVLQFKEIVLLKIRQLRRLNQSLFCLYASASCFLLTAVLPLLWPAWPYRGQTLLGGSLTWLIALGLLTSFSLRAVKIKQRQFKLLLEQKQEASGVLK